MSDQIQDVQQEVKEPVVEPETVEPVKEEKVVKPVLTDEESQDLIRFKILGNMTQQEAVAYHELLNKEAGI